jgi:hypothetical protein
MITNGGIYMPEQTKPSDIILNYIHAFLPLNEKEEREFQRQMRKLPTDERQAIEEMLADWRTRFPESPKA